MQLFLQLVSQWRCDTIGRYNAACNMLCLQIIPHLFSACNDFTELIGVTQCNFSCSLSFNCRKNPLQVAEDLLRVASLELQLAMVSKSPFNRCKK